MPRDGPFPRFVVVQQVWRRHRRLDDPGMDRVGPYSFSGVGRRRRLGQQPHRPLGRPVGRRVLRSYQPRHRRNVHDGPAPRLPHLRDGVLRPKKHPLAVDIHDLVPQLGRSLLHQPQLEDPRIVHQDIQLAELVRRRGHRPLPVLLLRHVQRHEDALPAKFVNLRLHPPALVLQDIPDNNLGPLPREQLRLHLALSPCSPADQGHLVLQSHNPPPRPVGAGPFPRLYPGPCHRQ